MRVPVAIIGSGNIGTDLAYKVIRASDRLELAAVAGIDPQSDGLRQAARLGAATTHDGVDGLVALPEYARVRVVFDATSAGAHARNATVVEADGKQIVDLTPAALGPYVVPSVNLPMHLGAGNVNMVTCGGQATVPIVAAVSRVAPVAYAEIVASIAARSAGPGTRANIDEFTRTTATALEEVGGAVRGKAVIVLNPAHPPLVMRNTVYCLVAAAGRAGERDLVASIEAMVAEVHGFVPGYRLKQPVQFDRVDEAFVPALGRGFAGTRVSVFLEIRGAGHYLPAYAGNLDIMTSAAVRTAERLVGLRGLAS